MTAGWAGPALADPAGSEAGALDQGRLTLRVLMTAIIVLSLGNLNPAIVGMADDAAERMQKILVAGLWVALIALTFVPGIRQRRPAAAGLMLPLLLLSWTMVSLLWSNLPANTAEKGAVLLLTSFGAWRLAASLRVDEFFHALSWGLAIIVAASLLLVLFVPSIGVLRTWQHAGQWSGLFVSKQTLGTVSALLVFLSLLRLLHGDRLFGLLSFALALACVIGSGSRGGAVLAAAAVASVSLARRSRIMATLLGLAPLALLVLAYAAVAALLITDQPHLTLFGDRVTLTERTLIWHFALDAWSDRPLLGFGTGGFWADPHFHLAFMRRHGWVLDNYHSGYVSVLVEHGLVGAMLLTAFVVALCRRLLRRMDEAHAAGPQARFAAEASLAFVLLCCTINLTETFFFRATDFIQVTLAFVTIQLFAWPGSTPPDDGATRRHPP